MLVLGIDPGTSNLGYGLVTEREIQEFGTIKLSKNDFETLRHQVDCMGNNVRLLIRTYRPDAIVLEDFIEQGKNTGKTYKEMVMLTEHLRMVARSCNMEANIYTNGFWKRKTLKATRATKRQVQHYIKNKFPEASELLKRQPSHVWDAVCIAYCHILVAKEQGRT
jgi:Holliday junction resolvasome RuvABC endonuclease subunit